VIEPSKYLIYRYTKDFGESISSVVCCGESTIKMHSAFEKAAMTIESPASPFSASTACLSPAIKMHKGIHTRAGSREVSHLIMFRVNCLVSSHLISASRDRV